MKRRSKLHKTKDFEPNFNVSLFGCNNSELHDFFFTVDAADQHSSSEPCFDNKGLVQVLFLLAVEWEIPVEAKFLAAELFSAFMTHHIRDVHKKIADGSSDDKQRDWTAVQHRLEKQLLLRICSCCQIASKIHSNYHIITVDLIQNLLETNGCHYSKECVLQSELRVLKTLDFHVSLKTPFTFIGTLLKMLANNSVPLDIAHCNTVAVKLLELCYVRRRQLYDKLYFVTTGCQNMSSDDKRKFCIVERDLVLLACGVVMAACHLVNSGHSEQVIEMITYSTRVTREDIVDMSSALLQLAFNMYGTTV